MFHHYNYDGTKDWNVVDWERDDGILQRGTVRNIHPRGLVVDFGCMGMAETKVNYGRVYESLDDGPPWKVPVLGAVEVLMRETAQGPWIWHSARLLTRDVGDSCMNLALVAVEWRGVASQQVVRDYQLRLPPTPEQLRARIIRAGHFELRTCRIPPFQSSAVQIFKALPWAMGRCTTPSPAWPLVLIKCWPGGYELVYLQQSIGIPWGYSSMVHAIHGMCGAEWSAANRRAEAFDPRRSGWRGCRVPRSLPFVAETGAWGEKLLHIGLHLLGNVMQHAGSLERVQQRRVCTTFNVLLTLPGLFTDITIRFPCCHGSCTRLCGTCRRGAHPEEYRVAASIVHCMTPSVRSILLADYQTDDVPYVIYMVLQVLMSAARLKPAGRRPLLLVASNCELLPGQCSFSLELADLAKDMRRAGAVCGTLLLKKCTIKMNEWLGGVAVHGPVRVESAEQDLWQAVEQGVPVVDRPPIAQWVARAVQEQSDDRYQVRQDLRDFAQGDPRPGAVYSQTIWTEENLADLDVARVSPLCAFALHCTMTAAPNHFPCLPFDNYGNY